MVISGRRVEQVEEKVALASRNIFNVTVSIDCEARTVTFETASKKLTSRLTGSPEAITHYGWGGANSENLFSDIGVE